MTDLTTGIRRAATPERSPGPNVTSTAGVNAGDPTLQSQPPIRTVGATAPAFPKAEGAHKSNGWHELTDVEIRAYTETMVVLNVPDGGSVALDPTRCQIWRVSVAGQTTIILPMPEFPTAATPRQDAPERMRTWSCVLMLSVPSGGSIPSFQGVSWSEKATIPDTLNPDGSQPVNYGGLYVFTFLFDPVSNVVLGFEGGMRF
ncbi:hypothetical protein [Allorhizobium borbori]|uniref:Uncharacterized protein n=1 Tax=Allorhizobium borbori TaxID=485907 RepID=A0A7W6JZI4_9HYPH|nr:hypothetical protein [Allorhizobium borbori]MBB4102405.1 hypothetical protein [Allorhizobium borbori]